MSLSLKTLTIDRDEWWPYYSLTEREDNHDEYPLAYVKLELPEEEYELIQAVDTLNGLVQGRLGVLYQAAFDRAQEKAKQDNENRDSKDSPS
jgi:hypothetical protein